MSVQIESIPESTQLGLQPYQRRVDELITDNAIARPHDQALVEPGNALSWSELEERVSEAAGHFLSAGLQEGDRVGFLIANSINAYVSVFGAMRAGAIVAPISTMLAPADVHRLVCDAGARTIIVGEAFSGLAEAARSTSENGEMPPWNLLEDLQKNAELRISDEGEPSHIDRACSIIYSSGTTGLPKGAVHTHEARVISGLNLAFAYSMHADSRCLVSTPPYTNGSWIMLLPALVTGASVFLTPRFESGTFQDACRSWKPTHAFIVPTQFQMLFEWKGFDTSCLESYKCMLTAGAPMPPEMKIRIMQAAPNRLYELWGLTEVAATFLRPDEMVKRPDSVGRALPLSEIRLIDNSDREVPTPGVGEIVARSCYQMVRYWGAPELNKEILWKSSDGISFMRTGDVGEFDAEGYLYIRGRVKDMIISGGLNVFPIDIENTLRTHDAITDAAVIGVPDTKWGEVPVAFVRFVGSDLDTQEVLRWANDRLSKFQRLVDVVLMQADFPRNTLGKVLKGELAHSYLEEHD